MEILIITIINATTELNETKRKKHKEQIERETKL